MVHTWHRATMSASLASISTTFPFPSSPHWAPKTTATLFWTSFNSWKRALFDDRDSWTSAKSVCPFFPPFLALSTQSTISAVHVVLLQSQLAIRTWRWKDLWRFQVKAIRKLYWKVQQPHDCNKFALFARLNAQLFLVAEPNKTAPELFGNDQWNVPSQFIRGQFYIGLSSILFQTFLGCKTS